MNAPGHQEWERALDGLEQHLARTEAMLLTLRPDEIDPWSPPELGTPLPGHLVDRAQSLLTRLETLQERIPDVAERVRRERAVTDRISRATARPRAAVYVDESA